MDFTAEQRATFEKRCDRIRFLMEKIRDNLENMHFPEYMRPIRGEKPYIWKRHKQLLAMSREELLHEIEADEVVLGDYETTYRSMIENDWLIESKEERYQAGWKHECDQIRARLDAIRLNPELLSHVSREDTHIWKRLDYWNSLTEEEMLEAVEADRKLLCYCFY